MIVNTGLAEVAKLTGQGLGGTKFDQVAIGTGSTAPAATQTALVAEITNGGGARNTGANVTATLITTAVANDTIQFDTTWAFTNTFGINEFGVFNGASTDIMLLRQTFASVLNIVSGDTLELLIDIQASDATGSSVSKITNAGLVEGNKLIATDLTPAFGPIISIGVGTDNGTILPLDATNTTLGKEIVTADSKGLARGQETAGPTVTITTTNVAGDTTTVTSKWGVTATVSVNEVGSFNSLTSNTGTMFVRYVFAAPLNLINTDTFTMIMNLVAIG